MHILQVGALPFPAPFGSQLYVAGLSKALAQRGHRVSMATFSGEGRAPEGVRWLRSDRARWANPVRSGPHWGRPLQDALLVRSIRRLLAQTEVDLIHAHHVEGVLAARIARGRRAVPIVYGMHTSLADELPDWFGRWAWPAGALIDGVLPMLTERTLCLSEAALKGDPRRSLAPPGYFPQELEGADAARARRRWSLSDAPLAVYVGNVDPYQNVPDLLQAMVCWPEGRLLLVLSSDSPSLRACAERLGLSERVRWVISRDFAHTKDAIAAADVGVMPRRRCAGFPMKLLNFLGLGCPVIGVQGAASPCPGLSLVPPADARAMAQAMRRITTDPGRAQLGTRAKVFAQRRFSWSARSGRVEAVYREVIRGGRERSWRRLRIKLAR